jgi:hypothetical protein
MSKKSFGSGYFGEWIEDEFGLPVYRYTCNQINDPKAITPVNEAFRSKTDHSFLVGNDRLAGVASNYGYIQIRQDEGSPKFLNDYDPENNQYAGGFGYLTDGNTTLSTYYNGKQDKFDRFYGIGYMRKFVEKNNLAIDQVIFAPYGDDPILISQITIKNNRQESVNLRWIEYWGCQIYQFSLEKYIAALTKKDPSLIVKLRRVQSKQLINKFVIIKDGVGLLNKKFDEKSLKSHDQIEQFDNLSFKKPSRKRASFEDKNPPPTFLVSLDKKADGWTTNGSNFFGKGGIISPDGLKKPFSSDTTFKNPESSMFLERKLHLESGESQTIYFAYGYIPEDFELDDLLKRYREELNGLWKKSCEQLKEQRIILKISDEPWVERELMWHYYYLRAAMTYDDYFMEHILSQGHVYQYLIGFQGAARDPLQHALPFIYSNPDIVKEIIRYTLKTIRPDGEIPYGITGNGIIMPAPWKPSDLELWLIWLASEYILSSRDTQFLDEEIPTYPVHGRKVGRSKVRDLLFLCYKHFTEITGTGKDGLQRLSNGDWNDMVIIGYVPEEKQPDVKKVAVSVLNSAMAIYVLSLYAEMLDFINDKELAEKALQYANSQRKAVKAQWMGQWFRRAWLNEEFGWIGEDQLWLEPQPWAIIGEVVDLEQKQILIQKIDELVRKPSKIGARLHSKGIQEDYKMIGIGANAGIWASINGTLVWALSTIDGEMAFDEWKKNTLAFHAEMFPEIWYGIWSGPDTLNSDLSKYPGQTVFAEYYLTGNPEDLKESSNIIGVNWTDFPVLNLHPHAWTLYTTTHLIGVKFTKDGVEYKPILPKEEYSFSSPLIGFEKSEIGYSGWYAPKVGGVWKVSLKLNKEELNLIKTLKVNGKKEQFVIEENLMKWEGVTAPDKPLYWEIEKG